jgi:hypothetical protein
MKPDSSVIPWSKNRLESKEGMKMKRLGLLALGLMMFPPACATITHPGKGGSPPVIGKIYASKNLRPGDTLKIYIQASDPDGDMQKVIVTLGRGDGPGPDFYISFTRLKKEDRKAISGYLYWYSGENANSLAHGRMTLQIQDMAGNLSNPIILPISFRWRARQESPPPGEFEEKEIGPIMIDIRPPGDGGN